MAGPGEDLPLEIPTDPAAAPIAAAAPTSDIAPVPPAGGDPTAVVPEPVAAPPDAAGSEQPPAAAEVPAAEPTLLEKFDAEEKAKADAEKAPVEAKPEDKPAEPEKPAEAEKPADEVPAAEPAEPAALEPIDYFEKLTIPETLQMDDTLKGEVTSAFDAFRADPVQGAQALVDLHNKTMTSYAEHLSREQFRVFNETRKGWQTEVMADPKLGGAGHQTAMGKIAQVRDRLVSDHKPGTEEYQSDHARMEEFLRVTGAGDHPWFLGMMHRAHRFVGEPGMPPANPKPPPNNGMKPGDRRARLYDKSQPNGG